MPDLSVEPAPPLSVAALPVVSAWLGAGSLSVPSEGLDAFADSDGLVCFGAGAGVSLAGSSELDVAAVATWDATGSSSRLRGEATSLGIMRFALGPELRGALHERLRYHGRLSPTLTRVSAELEESSSSVTLTDTRWTWGAEAALGLDVRFAEVALGSPEALGVFLRVEGGYVWSPAVDLALGADGGGAPVRTAPLELTELAVSGPALRVALGGGF